MVVDNSPEARLKKLQENNMGLGTTASNISKQVVSNTPSGITPISTPIPLATPSTTPTTGITPVTTTPTTPTQGVVPKTDLQSFSDATKGQDVEFRQSYRDSLSPTTTPTTTTTNTGAVGLDGAMLGAYNQLTDQEKKTYDSLALSGFKSQTDYLQKVKEQKEFSGNQEEKRVKMEANNIKMAEIASEERLAKAQKSLVDLKQNVGYLGMGGTPGKSQAKLDAVTKQVSDSENTYRNIVEVERLMGENRTLGQQSNAEQYSRQLEILQDDLNSKVNKTIQSAMNEFSAKEMEGKLDTIPEIEEFQQQIYSQMDNDISSLTDINLEARKFLIERYDALAKTQKEQMQANQKAEAEKQKQSNTLNKDMSNALGYYVNELGEPLTDKVTGQRIIVPPESDITYDKDSGQAVIITKNRDGTMGVQLKQIGTAKAEAPKTTTIDNPDGTKTTMQWTGSQWSPIQSPEGSTDFRSLSYKYPNEASMKNNNPAGITWNNNFDNNAGFANILQQNGVNFTKGTERPANEGGAYVSFPTVQDGLKAYDLLWQQPQYQNMTVQSALNRWGTGSLNLGGINPNSTISSLSPEQLQMIKSNQLKKESPGFAKELGNLKIQAPTQTGAYSEDDYINKITAMLPAGMKDNKSEMDRVTKIAKSYMTQGLSPQEASLKFTGYDIQDKDYADLGMQYMDIGDNLLTLKPKNYESTVSKYINKGDFDGLNTYINGLADDKVSDRYGADSVLSTTYKVGNDRTDKVVELINKNKDKIGVFDGNVNDFLNKFQSDPEYQKLKTILTMSQADTRKYFAGSAVTATEMDALKDFIGGKTTMTPENLTTILETIKEDRTNTYQTQRRGMLPPDTRTVQTQKKLGIKGGLQDFMSELTTLLQ